MNNRTLLRNYAVSGDADDPLIARDFPAPVRLTRTPFQRDRDRVVQARAFRRLAGKTQVFTRRASDHFRSRLTHTIEVVQIARQVAATLGLNEDLAEVLALVHDIGHPPFGHAGERALDLCLQRHGLRFDHNLHALRIVVHFEQRYAYHRGLNLTLGVREGIIKHSRDYNPDDYPGLATYFPGLRPPLEAQIIDLADEIAYLTADLDDGVESELLEIDGILENVEVIRNAYLGVEKRIAADLATPVPQKFIFYDALQRMQHALIDDLIANTQQLIVANGIRTLDDVREHPARLAVFSDKVESQRRQEKQYLYDALYTCETLEREHQSAADVVTALFEYWVANPAELPASYAEEVERDGPARITADYIAGMTDSYILDQHDRVFGK